MEKKNLCFFQKYFYAKDMDSNGGQKICTEYFHQIWTLTSSEVC